MYFFIKASLNAKNKVKKSAAVIKYAGTTSDLVLLKGVANSGSAMSNPPISDNAVNIFSLYSLIALWLTEASCA